MAARELPPALRRLILRDARPANAPSSRAFRRHASTEAAAAQEDMQDLESQSSLLSEGPLDERVKSFDPIKRAAARKEQLPSSRYVVVYALGISRIGFMPLVLTSP